MNKRIPFLISAFILVAFSISGCKKDELTFGPLTAPDVPEIHIRLAGQDENNPNGDGSGGVTVSVTSKNAISYKVDFGDGRAPVISTKNSFNYNYSLPTGDNDLTITVIALGRGGTMSSASKEFTIYRSFTPSEDLVRILTANRTRTWRVDKDAPGHLGVGPADTFNPDWWAAGPNEKVNDGIYDDTYVFNGTTMMFTHNTNNSIFGKKEYLTDFDPSLTGDGDYTLEGEKASSYDEKFGYDGGPGGVEYITFSHRGHLGMYLGVHRYQIVSMTDNQMTLRCLQDPGAWYVKIIAID